jgi:Mg/Co/Ni transporter MgtE
MNTRRRLRGGIALADLVRTAEGERLRNVLRPVQTVRAEADLEEVARLMTDFDLTIVPVVDEDDRILGIVTVDDVLELVLPEPWRRRFGLLGSD